LLHRSIASPLYCFTALLLHRSIASPLYCLTV
jgi:hypothetical protein